MKKVTWNRGLTYANRKYDVATLEGSTRFWDGSITKVSDSDSTMWRASAYGQSAYFIQYENAVEWTERQLRGTS